MPANEASRPTYRGEGVRELLQNYDRGPFRDVLAELLDAMPSPEQLKKFAALHPDRYFTSLSGIAKLAGFSEKTEHLHHHRLEYDKMSDVELEQRLLEKTRLLSDQRRTVESGRPETEKSPDPETEAFKVIDGDYEELDV